MQSSLNVLRRIPWDRRGQLNYIHPLSKTLATQENRTRSPRPFSVSCSRYLSAAFHPPSSFSFCVVRRRRTAMPASGDPCVCCLTGTWRRMGSMSFHRGEGIGRITTADSVPVAPFRLDPPFTPVPGERQAIDTILTGSIPFTDGDRHVNVKDTSLNNDTEGRRVSLDKDRNGDEDMEKKEPQVTPCGRPPYQRVVYRCQRCRAPLFRSDDLVSASSSAPVHLSGWPTFSASIHPSALRYRTRLQRQTITKDTGTLKLSADEGNTNGIKGGQDILKTSYLGATTLVSRPLAVEGDDPSHRRGGGRGMVVSRSLALSPLEAALQQHRQRGRAYRQKYVTTASPLLRGAAFTTCDVGTSARHKGKTKRWSMTWRERCLRDVNQRADPSYIEGCCQGCGTAVCRVLEDPKGVGVYAVGHRRLPPGDEGEAERVSGSHQSMGKYISTASVLLAVPSE